MYQAVYGLNTIGEFHSFEEAFAAIYHRLNEDMKAEQMSYQFLETTIWIENKMMMPVPPINPIFFYDARDKAVNIGLLQDGKLQEDVLETAKKYAKKISEQSKETD
jgi:hypothetical protein